MKYEDHCFQSIQLFGKAWEEIHRWLDEFSGKPGFGMRHRRARHNMAGLLEVEKLFGKEAVPVAKQHIIEDLKEEGWKETDHFPNDENDYIKMGLF